MNTIKAKQSSLNKIIMRTIKDKFTTQERVTCFDCNECHCCKSREDIVITKNELEILKTFLTPEIEAKGKEAIRRYKEGGYWDCPFLDDNGKCSVYEYRPFSCSSCVVYTPVEKCIVVEGEDIEVGTLNPISLVEELPDKYKDTIVSDCASLFSMLDIFKELDNGIR